MDTLLKVEFAALFIFSIFLFSMLPYAWWWFLVLLLLPDISMAGYAINPRIGSLTYNLVHLLAIGVIVYLAGYFMLSNLIQLIGVILIAHTSMDRVFGYGLKYPDSFKHTHLRKL